MSRTALHTALGIVMILLASTLAGLSMGKPLGERPLMAELQEVARRQEVAGVRLSVASGLRTCAAERSSAAASSGPRSPGCGAISAVPSEEAVALINRTTNATRISAHPDTLHAAALANLLFPDPSGNLLRESISHLQSASRLARRSGPVLADLAAAHLMRAEAAGSTRDLLEALEASQRALEQEPDNLAARFNAAEAMDRIGMARQAAGAWRDYLVMDSTSPWGHEARRRLRRLSPKPRPAVPARSATPAEAAAYAVTAPQEARELGWDHLLPEWGAAILAGDTATATARLEQAEALGGALVSRGGDASLADAVTAIRAVPKNSASLRRVARAYTAYGRGREAHFASRHADSRTALRPLLGNDTPPVLRAWAETHHGICMHYDRRKGEDAAHEMRRLAGRGDSARHPALAGRRWGALAAILIAAGEYGEAMEPLERALRLTRRAGERENQGGVMQHLGYAHAELGDSERGYSWFQEGLAVLRDYPGSYRRFNLLLAMGQEAVADGLPRAAARIGDEMVSHEMSDPYHAAEAHLARARLSLAGGRKDVAADVAAAMRLLEGRQAEYPRKWLEADLRDARALAWLSARPAAAAAELDSVVAYFERRNNPDRLVPALVARAEARLATARPGDAASDLRRAAAKIDTLSARVSRGFLRAMLLERSRGFLDRAIMLAVRRGDPAEALAYMEQSRSSPGPVERPATERPRRRRGEVGVELALVGDTLLAWTEGPDGLHLSVTPARRTELLRLAEVIRSGMEGSPQDAAVQPALEALYDRLVRPIRGRLGPRGTLLVLVADGELAAIPMAALRDRESGRYLAHDHPIRFASTLHEPAAPPAAPPAPGTPVTLVADPAFDPRAFPWLTPLEGAAAEARAIGRATGAARVVAGKEADTAAVGAAFRRGGIAHFAGHAVFDDARPERSFLVTAARRDGGDRLTAAEIERMSLGGLRLVVLSACQTSRAQAGRSGGFAGLAGAFLAAGADGVVGSLWRVDDQHTRVLMEAFHRAYRVSGDAPRALREAQLELLRSPDARVRAPAAWGGFRYMGR